MKDYEERRMEKAYIGCGMTMAWAMVVLFIFLLMTLSSCRSIQYVPVVEHHTDTLKITALQRDSIYLHDSTFIKEKADTILIEKWHTKYVEKLVCDTISRHKIDTIPQPYPVTVEVEKRLSWWQQTRLQFSNIVMLLMIGAVAWWIIKRKVIP